MVRLRELKNSSRHEHVRTFASFLRRRPAWTQVSRYTAQSGREPKQGLIPRKHGKSRKLAVIQPEPEPIGADSSSPTKHEWKDIGLLHSNN
jgi:hypothetical protein